MQALLLLLQETTGEGSAPPSASPWPLLIGIVVIFYFLMIRPQMKEQKKRREMLSQLKKNDRVLTTGGMYGTIVTIADDEVTLKIDDSQNVRVRFTRAAIAGLAPVKAKAEKDAKESDVPAA